MNHDYTERKCLPIFIAGPVRSGTTLLRWILDSHPRIVCRSEHYYLKPFITAFRDQFLQEPAGEAFDREKLARLAKIHGVHVHAPALAKAFRKFHEHVYVQLIRATKKQRWADGTHQVLDFHIAVIDTIYDHKPLYLVVTRHGLDAAVSAMEKFPYQTFHKFLVYWSTVIDLHQAFRALNPDRCLMIKYENLVSCPQRELEAIWQFLGEDCLADAERLIFQRDHGPRFGDHKIGSVPAIHQSSVGRWRNVPAALYMPAVRDCPEFNENMVRCGYEPIIAD